jgi:hypothetical protein
MFGQIPGAGAGDNRKGSYLPLLLMDGLPRFRVRRWLGVGKHLRSLQQGVTLVGL